MRFSIIIPHKGREAHLSLCIQSLLESAEIAELVPDDWEIVVVGKLDVSLLSRGDKGPLRIIDAITVPPFLDLRPNEPPPFWKNRLLNVGISAAKGDILTFLDADAIVGPMFFLAARKAVNYSYVTYRVRKVSFETANATKADSLALMCCQYPEGFPICYEAYHAADNNCRNHPPNEGIVFGNSQFSITRENLGDLRFDKSYWGRGYEDLSMLRSLHAKFKGRKQASIVTEPSQALFHISHEYSPGFGLDRWNDRNKRRYYGTHCLWIISDSRDRIESFKAMMLAGYLVPHHEATIRYRRTEDYDPQEANVETDAVLNLDAATFFTTPIQENHCETKQ